MRSSDLVGMQPTLLQTPPQYFSSMMRGLQAELGGADRGDVAAGAGTEHDDVIVGSSWPYFRGAARRADHCPGCADTLGVSVSNNLTYELSSLA